MADASNKVPENVPGKYYVDEECILCNECLEMAPENFDVTDDYAYVKKQPETAQEEDQCQEALDTCPVNAIGDDGED